jgi:iron-sulfur cluster assembly protein
MSYTLEYADQIESYDEVVDVKTSNGEEFKIVIDPKAIMFLLGTEMVYQEDKFKSGFEFINPNEKGRCGCGESFTV